MEQLIRCQKPMLHREYWEVFIMTLREKIAKREEISKEIMRSFNMELLINSEAVDIDLTVYKSSKGDDIIILNGGHRDDLFVQMLLMKEKEYNICKSVLGYISSFMYEGHDEYVLSYCNGTEGVENFLGASSAVSVMKKLCESKAIIDLTKMCYIRGGELIKTEYDSDKYHDTSYMNFGDILQ